MSGTGGQRELRGYVGAPGSSVVLWIVEGEFTLVGIIRAEIGAMVAGFFSFAFWVSSCRLNPSIIVPVAFEALFAGVCLPLGVLPSALEGDTRDDLAAAFIFAMLKGFGL